MSDLEKRLRAAREAADRDERERRERAEEAKRARAPLEAFRDRYHLLDVPPELSARTEDPPASHAAVVRDFAARLPDRAWQHAGWIVADHEGTPRLVPRDWFVYVKEESGYRSYSAWFHGPDGRKPVPPSEWTRFRERSRKAGASRRDVERFKADVDRAVARAEEALNRDGARVRVVHVKRVDETPQPTDSDGYSFAAPILVSVHLLDMGDRVVSVTGRTVRLLHYDDRLNGLVWGTVEEFTEACVKVLLELEREARPRGGT